MGRAGFSKSVFNRDSIGHLNTRDDFATPIHLVPKANRAEGRRLDEILGHAKIRFQSGLWLAGSPEGTGTSVSRDIGTPGRGTPCSSHSIFWARAERPA